MRVLVTGGAGFIGSHLVRRLARRGWEVRVLDDLSTGQFGAELAGLAETIEGDVRDADTIRRAARGVDAIYHLAAVVGVRQALEHQVRSLTVNLMGVANILECACESGAAIFLASSSAIYGKTRQVPIHEVDDVLLGNTHKPCWTYSYAKVTEELLARAWAAEHGVKVKIGRFFNVIGPGQTGAYGMVVPRFVAAALTGRPLMVYGQGDHTRTFLDIEDALAGMDLIMERGSWGEVYNIGGTREIRVLDLARRILTLTQSTSPVDFVPFASVYGEEFEEVERRVPDISRLTALGYRPRRSLDDTLLAVIEEQRQRRLQR
ncbi:MAG: NAD-dependent epimerase/dehydratase family protein [Symbiobacteriia bacterium]